MYVRQSDQHKFVTFDFSMEFVAQSIISYNSIWCFERVFYLAVERYLKNFKINHEFLLPFMFLLFSFWLLWTLIFIKTSKGTTILMTSKFLYFYRTVMLSNFVVAEVRKSPKKGKLWRRFVRNSVQFRRRKRKKKPEGTLNVNKENPKNLRKQGRYEV